MGSRQDHANTPFLRIRDKFEQMSAQQKIIADFILDRGEQVSFLTAKQIADAVQVSPSTVIRFTQFLGYGSYIDFLDELKRIVLKNYIPMRKLKESLYAEESDAHSLSATCRYEITSIENLLSPEQETSFHDAVQLMIRAKTIWIIGARSAYALVYYAGFLLKQLVKNVRFFPSGAENAFEQLDEMKKGDVLISVCFYRYARTTVELTKFVNDRQMKIIGITDGITAPISDFSDVVLCAPNNAPFYSYVSAMALFDALIWAYAKGKKGQIEVNFEKRAQMLLENNIYV